jgi:folate-dependent phosphoribosylglycinamide formyltransferase PurN
MHVGILTYQTGHLKTWQMTQRILAKGYRVTLFAFPFKVRPANAPKRDEGQRFSDRPAQLIDIDVEAYCSNYGIGYQRVDGWTDSDAEVLGAVGGRDTPDIFLHCFAKIVPESFLRGRTILNAHPGLLPQNRGVDALKRCIVEPWPIGVTLHIIDKEIDRGEILRRARVPILPSDRLVDVCQRVYDLELDLMGNFEHHLKNKDKHWQVGEAYPCSHEKIPLDLDLRLEDVFMRNRDELVRLSKDLSVHAHASDGAEEALFGCRVEIDGEFSHG